jgi:hypothetical protein
VVWSNVLYRKGQSDLVLPCKKVKVDGIRVNCFVGMCEEVLVVELTLMLE